MLRAWDVLSFCSGQERVEASGSGAFGLVFGVQGFRRFGGLGFTG